MKKFDPLDKKNWFDKKGNRYRYFSPDGHGYEDVLDWAKDFEPSLQTNMAVYEKYRIVRQEDLFFGWFFVSTVWLGLDHQFNDNEPPMIYESMVFNDSPFKGKYGGELAIERYTTRKQALAGHRELVRQFTFPLIVITLIKKWYDGFSFDLWMKRRRLQLFVGGIHERFNRTFSQWKQNIWR